MCCSLKKKMQHRSKFRVTSYQNDLSCLASAEEALSRTGEVDIEGGWQVGAPYVAITYIT